MSERRSPRRAWLAPVSAVALAAALWAGWYGHLTPSICGLGADSVGATDGERKALASERRGASGCDGHSLECQFSIVGFAGTGDFMVVVTRQPVDFWTRRCRSVSDGQSVHPYTSSGAASSPL